MKTVPPKEIESGSAEKLIGALYTYEKCSVEQRAVIRLGFKWLLEEVDAIDQEATP